MHKINEIVDNGLCMGCGVCHDICPRKCINIIHKNTIYANINEDECVNCGLCYEVCPGKGVKLRAESKKLFTNTIYNEYVGNYKSLYVGYSNDYEIRYHSASGGITTSIIKYLFEKKYIDGAVVVGFETDNIMIPRSYIARNVDNLLFSKSSKYCITSYENIINEIKNSPGKYIVVGLPCQIQAFRLFEHKNKCVENSIIGHFSLYCSLNKTIQSTNYYLYRYGIDKKTLCNFAYRDEGCLGYMIARGKNNDIIRKVPYLDFWFGTHSFFTNPRCNLCYDHFGELADVSLGDINIYPYNLDKVGINSIIVRNQYWDTIINKIFAEGYITLKDLPLGDLIKSQPYVISYKKGNGISTIYKYRKLVHRRNPINDEIMGNFSLKCLLKYFSNKIMFHIGSKKRYWFLIKLLDRR